MSEQHFLLIDDNPVFASTLARALTRRGFAVQIAHDASAALALARTRAFDAITVDLHLGPDPGLPLIAPLRALQPKASILVLTGYASIATAVQAVKDGADNYLAKPANAETILASLRLDASEARAEAALERPSPLSVARLEWEHIQRVLAEHDGNVSATARALNMHRRTLQRKLAKKPVKQ
ncbi:MAG: response regulator transcription factor [Burkholderiales bacterium]|nr:response regulator transcription factor [Burkholderiales bacterium]MDE2609334.1 response regulator transcription factor [Burkholderiales bacterium]